MKNASKRQDANNKSARFKVSLVAGACALALGGGGAMAQTTTYTTTTAALTLTTAANLAGYTHGNLNDQFGLGIVSAAEVNELFTITLFDGAGAASAATPATLTSNTIQAIARGNQYSAAAPSTLGLLGTGDSLGLLSSQTQGTLGSPSPVTARVTNGDVTITVTNYVPATNVLRDNTVSADVLINTADQSISGQLPSGYSNSQPGAIGMTSTGLAITNTNTASIGVTNGQAAINSSLTNGSRSTVTGSQISLTLTDPNAGTITAADSQTVQDNTIAANFQVNGATNIVQASAGSAPVNGSVAVANNQLNLETGGATAQTALTASITTSGISATYSDAPIGGGILTLNAPLVLSDNTMSAASTGNIAGARDASGNILAGNAIVLSDGVNATGPGSTRTNSLDASALSATTGADLAVANAQGNVGTGLNSRITNGFVTVTGDQIGATGSVTANGNAITAAVDGNLAGNLIQTSATNVNASVAASNMQLNDSTAMEARVTNGSISAIIGSATNPVGGATTLNANEISGIANGNTQQTTLNLAATNLTLPSTGSGAATSAATETVNTTSGVGASATNLQANFGPAFTIAGTVTGATVSAEFESGDGGARQGLQTAAVTVNANTIEGSATGNTGATNVILGTGLVGTTNTTGSAALANGQFNENTIAGTVTNSGVAITALRAAASPVTANSNTIASSATANDGTNSMSSSVTNLTVLATPFSSSAADTNLQATGSNAALALASGQLNEGSVTSRTTSTGAFVQVDISGTGGTATGITAGSHTSVNLNAVTSSTNGNIVDNTLAIDATNLATTTGSAGQVGSLVNYQENDTAGTATALVQQSGGGQSIGITFGGGAGSAVSASNLTVSGNTMNATVAGNTAGNTVGLSAQNYGSTAAGFSGRLDATASTGITSVNNEFALVNRQVDTVAGGRTATVTAPVVSVDSNATATVLTGANVTISENSIVADARNNSADNAMTLTGVLNTNLSTGGGVANEQSSSTNVGASITNADTRFTLLNATASAIGGNSNLTVSNNATTGVAAGNVASNSLTVGAENLTGNAIFPAAGIAAVDTGAAQQVTVIADFGVGNNQRQTGTVTSGVEASTRIDFAGGTMTGGSASVSDNTLSALAQANSATSGVTLNATNTAATGMIASYQIGEGAVTASQTTTNGSELYGIVGAATANTPVTVNGNGSITSAGQNEAFNTIKVFATTLPTSGVDSASSFTIGGAGLAGADYSLVSAQVGSGSVLATSVPRLIGIRIPLITNLAGTGSVSVNNNYVLSAASVNRAGNGIQLSGLSTIGATAALVNGQVSSAPTVSATVTNTDIGVALPVVAAPVSITGTPVTVNGNSVAASANANSATNAVDLTAGAVINIGGNNGAVVLSNQQSGSVLNTDVTSTNIGFTGGTQAGSSIATSPLSVRDNAVSATSTANSAGNSLVLNAGATLSSQGSVGNTQVNLAGANGTASIANANVGAITSGAGSLTIDTSPVSVSGNSLNATAGANSASNSLEATAGGTIGAGTAPTFAVLNSQSNAGTMAANVTTASIGIISGGVAGTGAINGSPVAVTGNQVLAMGYGNMASNSLTTSSLMGNANAASTSLTNSQSNTAAISATVTGVTVGIINGTSSGGSNAVVSNNSSIASATGNSAVNMLLSK